MQINVTARHMTLTDGLRDHVEKALDKIRNHFDRIIDANVVLEVEKHRHIAEITLNANGLRIHGKEESQDMYTSVDAVIAKLDKQIKKHKDRIKSYKQRAMAEERNYQHEVLEMFEGGPSEAEAGGRHVINREKLPMRPMSVEDAAMQLDLSGDRFIAFANAETQQLNVIYSRDDGTYGLIEPQF